MSFTVLKNDDKFLLRWGKEKDEALLIWTDLKLGPAGVGADELSAQRVADGQ